MRSNPFDMCGASYIDFNFGNDLNKLKIKGNINKLLIKRYSPWTSQPCVDEIYSLPGNMPNSITKFNSPNTQMPYPNPINTIINLPYILNDGQTSIMSIFNSNGQLIEQKQIDSVFDKILLNVESYQHGVYVYEYNGISNRFIVN